MPLTLLDYGKLNPFGDTIGRPRRLAWPVNVYRVTLPKASDDGGIINPFERVILRLLIAVGAMDASALAQETCIPLDLIKSILLRLQDKGLIDPHNTIVEQNLDDSQTQEGRATVFVTALLFRELATGKILPFLHVVDDRHPLRKREEEHFVQIVRANQAYKQCVPGPRDVISALRAMTKRLRAFGNDDKMPAVQNISIVPRPEMHYLDCPAAIQKSDGEVRIADPFGNGFSLVLESALARLLEHDDKLINWLSKWKESLRNPRPSISDDLDPRPKEPFDTEANWQRYPKLVASMRPSRNTSFRSISKIHASLEWALFYACSCRPFQEAIASLTFTPQLTHPALLHSAAHDSGFEPPEFGFRPISGGKLLDFQNGQAELGTVLAIAILQARNDDSHPLRRIAPLHPDFVSRLLDVKKRRDDIRHGKGGPDAPEVELADDPFMREIVHALLPDIIFAATPVAGPDKDARADSIFEARDSIQGEFGFKVFNRLGANLQNRLIHAERFWLSCKDGDDANVFANDLYAAVQAACMKELVRRLPPDISDSEFLGVALKKAASSGLCETLPKCLRTVKTLAIRQTLQGAGQTLGSCIIAFLLVSESDTLRAIADSQPSFMDDIEDVLANGHGNEPLPLPRADVAKLRKASYTTIRTLLET